MKMKYSKLVVAFAAMTSVTAMGAGFGLYEASARGLGMAMVLSDPLAMPLPTTTTPLTLRNLRILPLWSA
jgi:hypothetical protein